MTRSSFGSRLLAFVAVAFVAALLAPTTPAYALPPAPSNIKIEIDGSASTKSMGLTWTPTTYSPFNSYEFFSGSGSGTIDWYDYTTNKSQTTYTLGGWGDKNTPGSFVLGNTYSVGMDIAEGSGVFGPKALADVKVVATPTPTVTSSTTSSISISWTAAATGDPFVEYDLFVAPSSYAGDLANCYSTYEATKTTTTKTLTTVPTACGGGSIVAATSYKVGVRVIQRTGNPSVWTKVGQTTGTTPSALPTQCQVASSTNEAFCAVYPNAFVKNSSWPAAEQGQAVTLNGANTKYGPRLDGTWNTSSVTSIFSQIHSAGPTAFNAVRVNLDWGMFQYKSGSTVVVDSAALTELDTVIDSAITNGLYVILVPVHIRQPGSLCTVSGNRLYNATFNVPRWAWDQIDPTLPTGGCTSYPSQFDDLVDDAVSLPDAQTYFRTLANRYSDYSTTAKGNRSRQVVAIDLVNEMTGDGAAIVNEQDKILQVYQNVITDLRTNTTATKKLMVVEAAHGDTSYKLNDTDLDALAGASTNIILSFHDYFGGAPGGGTLTGSGTYGLGYSSSGFVSGTYQERTDGAARTYTYANEASQHRTYVEQMASWAAGAGSGLPLYIGEYGVYNSCSGNVQSEANSYASDTKGLYDSVTMLVGGSNVAVPVSRTWWTHGYAGNDSSMDLRRMSSGCASQAAGTYFAHAFNL